MKIAYLNFFLKKSFKDNEGTHLVVEESHYIGLQKVQLYLIFMKIADSLSSPIPSNLFHDILPLTFCI